MMIILNGAIIYKFMMARCKKRKGSQSTSQALSKSATRGTVMLLTVSSTFIMLTGPQALAWYINPHPPQMVQGIVMLLQYLNHAINGFLYCIVGSKFRKELFKILKCYKPISLLKIKNTARRSIASQTESDLSASIFSRSTRTTITSMIQSNNIADLVETGSPM